MKTLINPQPQIQTKIQYFAAVAPSLTSRNYMLVDAPQIKFNCVDNTSRQTQFKYYNERYNELLISDPELAILFKKTYKKIQTVYTFEPAEYMSAQSFLYQQAQARLKKVHNTFDKLLRQTKTLQEINELIEKHNLSFNQRITSTLNELNSRIPRGEQLFEQIRNQAHHIATIDLDKINNSAIINTIKDELRQSNDNHILFARETMSQNLRLHIPFIPYDKAELKHHYKQNIDELYDYLKSLSPTLTALPPTTFDNASYTIKQRYVDNPDPFVLYNENAIPFKCLSKNTRKKPVRSKPITDIPLSTITQFKSSRYTISPKDIIKINIKSSKDIITEFANNITHAPDEEKLRQSFPNLDLYENYYRYIFSIKDAHEEFDLHSTIINSLINVLSYYQNFNEDNAYQLFDNYTPDLSNENRITYKSLLYYISNYNK